MQEVLPKLEARFGKWLAADVPTKNIDTVERKQKTSRFISSTGPHRHNQFLFAGHVCQRRKQNPDEIATIAANDAIGGGFMSRINLNLREDKQWSYGARTGLASARGQRFFYITTGVQSDKNR